MTFSFEIQVSDLAAMMRPVGSGAAAKVTPIYGCSLIELTAAGRLTISSADSVMSLSQWTQCEHHDGAGRAAIPREHISKILAAIPPAATVYLLSEDGDLKMRYGEARYSFAGMPVSDFPPLISVPEGSREISIEIAEIVRALKRVRASVYDGDSKPHIFGVNLRSFEKGIRVAGADGHVISIAVIENSADDLDVTLPPEVSDVISRFSSDAEAIFRVGQHTVGIDLPSMRYASLVTGSSFIDYAPLLKDEVEVTACEVDRGLLVDALRRLNVVAGDGISGVGIVGEIANSTLRLRLEARGVSGGNGAEVIPCQTVGADQKIGFNASLLLQTLKQSQSEMAALVINDGKRIFVETLDGRDIVMARRVNFHQTEE